MTDEEIRETRLKVLEKDLASINNRLHHAFNQGFELGRKSTTPKEKTGKWRHYEGMLICSECGAEFYDDIMEYCGDDIPKYCPDCGARMVEPQESEDKE